MSSRRPAAALPLACLLALAALCSAPSALANRKTDVITLYNGDRITGEIKYLADGILDFSTDAMGTIKVEWKEVAALASNYNYEVRLRDGQRLFGTVQAGSEPGTVALRDVYGEKSLGWEEVVEIRPLEDKLTDKLEIYLSANYSFTKASGVAQTELNGTVNFNQRDTISSLTSRLTVSNTDEDSTTSSRINMQRKHWTDRRGVYRVAFGGFESNDELGLDARYTIGGGVGRYFLETNQRTLSGGLALQALTEHAEDGTQQESVEAVLSSEFALWRFDTPELDLDFEANVYPSLTKGGRVRADSSARLRWEIISDLYWNINSWVSYDNETADEEGGEFDWGITTGLGWNF